MINLQNSFERYLGALRNFVSISITKHGLQERHLKNLKKIYFCEMILNKKVVKCVDISTLTSNLLNAARYLSPNTNLRVNTNGNIFINIELYTFLILNIFKNSSLSVFFYNDFLCIKFFGNFQRLSPIIKALNASILYEIKTDQSILYIPIKKATQPSIYIESDWEFLFDSFSIVNLIFKT